MVQTASAFQNLIVEDALVLLDRQQGGQMRLKRRGVNLAAILTLEAVLRYLGTSKRNFARMVSRESEIPGETPRQSLEHWSSMPVLLPLPLGEGIGSAATDYLPTVLETRGARGSTVGSASSGNRGCSSRAGEHGTK